MVSEVLSATAPPVIVMTMQEHVLSLLLLFAAMLLFAAIPDICGGGSDCTVVKKLEG
jgi:hypothetical protein